MYSNGKKPQIVFSAASAPLLDPGDDLIHAPLCSAGGPDEGRRGGGNPSQVLHAQLLR